MGEGKAQVFNRFKEKKMKTNFRAIALGLMSLAIVSCDKSEPINNGTNGGELSGEPTRFEMSSSLGAVGVETLSSNTDKADDLRAALHFKGLNLVTKTTLDAEKFGESKFNARWGVKHNGGNYGENCPISKNADLSETEKKTMTQSTVCFIGTNNNSIGEAGAKVKMYSTTQKTLNNITKGIMILGGEAGATPEQQYFMKGKCDPNERIEGVTVGEFQEGRHIPIMTPLVDFSKIKASSPDNGEVKFAPRGSLIGLLLKNKTGEQITITDIIVPKAGALGFAGSFSWAGDGNATFTTEYDASQAGTALELPVYTKGASVKGYVLTNNNADVPCFFVWGFQKSDKKGESFQVQIRYKTSSNKVETTRTFNVYAPTSKVTPSERMFDDGYAYNTSLTIHAGNNTGGSNGTDWNDGGVLQVLRQNPLDYVAPFPIRKDAKGFVNSYKYPVSDVFANLQDDEVGYFTFDEAKMLFTSGKAFLSNYELPTMMQARSILPSDGYVRYDAATSSTKELTEDAQVGNTSVKSYTSKYKTIEEGGRLLVYAVRFIGTEYESAWRYSYEGEVNKKRLVIQCLALETNTGDINQLNEDFFKNKVITERTMLTYGSAYPSAITGYRELGEVALFATSTENGTDQYYRWGGAAVEASTYSATINALLPVLPFYKQLP